jgi:hypothetical protein
VRLPKISSNIPGKPLSLVLSLHCSTAKKTYKDATVAEILDQIVITSPGMS